MADENPHVHSYTESQVENPQGVSSDGKRAVYVVQKHKFCGGCGDFQVENIGTVER